MLLDHGPCRRCPAADDGPFPDACPEAQDRPLRERLERRARDGRERTRERDASLADVLPRPATLLVLLGEILAAGTNRNGDERTTEDAADDGRDDTRPGKDDLLRGRERLLRCLRLFRLLDRSLEKVARGRGLLRDGLVGLRSPAQEVACRGHLAPTGQYT